MEKFCLKWNDFQTTVSQSFGLLRKEEDFFDVTLVTDDEIQIPAHKLVLATSSCFFKSILRKSSHSHPLLYLHGVNSKNLRYINGWEWELFLNTDLKKLLDEASTSLWAEICTSSSVTNVTSKKSSSFLNNPKDWDTVVWKSFHLRQNFSIELWWNTVDSNLNELLRYFWIFLPYFVILTKMKQHEKIKIHQNEKRKSCKWYGWW